MDRCAERIVSQFPVNCRKDDGKKSARRKGIHLDRVVGGDRHPWHFGRAAHTSVVVRGNSKRAGPPVPTIIGSSHWLPLCTQVMIQRDGYRR